MKNFQKLAALLVLVVLVFGTAPAYSAAKKGTQKKVQSGEAATKPKQTKTETQVEDAQAQFMRGLMYYEQKNYVEAFRWYRKAAEQGLAQAQYNVGVMYDKGDVVKQDRSEAFKWYLKAAEQGHLYAQCNVGVGYYDGYVVKQDYTEAFKWHSKAAQQGFAPAQYNLGLMYYRGHGVPQNKSEAINLFRKAAIQGHNTAQELLIQIGETW